MFYTFMRSNKNDMINDLLTVVNHGLVKYRLVTIKKVGNGYTVFGKPVPTIEAAKTIIDNSYLSLQKSIR